MAKFKFLRGRSCLSFFAFSTLIYCIIRYRTINCSSINTETTDYVKLPAYIITVPGYDGRVPIVAKLFKQYANIRLRTFYGVDGNVIYRNITNSTLKPGEMGLRETMKRFFRMMILENHTEIMVFEDDVLPHYKFPLLFHSLEKRCRTADILLLGATYANASKLKPSDVCLDADRYTAGAFALLIQNAAFKVILDLLENGYPIPFDNMYRNFQRAGLVVRIAFPDFLAIPDVTHASLVNNKRRRTQFNLTFRSQVHGWNLSNYPIFALPLLANASKHEPSV